MYQSINDYQRGFEDGQRDRKREYERGYRDGYGSGGPHVWPSYPYDLTPRPMWNFEYTHPLQSSGTVIGNGMSLCVN